MGWTRGWEEDGVFERGVEVLGGDAEGIWLEKGSQRCVGLQDFPQKKADRNSFQFSILLPATLATHDYHQFGRISYMLTARVEGIPSSSSITHIFRKDAPAISSDIPFKEDFDTVIARSDKLSQDKAVHRTESRGSFSSTERRASLIAEFGTPEDSAIALGEGSPTLTGLYHRRQSSDLQNIPPLSLGSLSLTEEQRSIQQLRAAPDIAGRSEKTGWLKGDLLTTRSLLIHANPSTYGGVSQLDLRKEGFVAGLNSWRFSAISDVVPDPSSDHLNH